MMQTKKLQLPLIHLNGSGKENLSRDYRRVFDAAHDLQEALAQATPHDRDYYPLGPEAYQKARDQHSEWHRLTDKVYSDMHRILVGIYNGGHGHDGEDDA